MKEQTGESYSPSEYEQGLYVSEAKAGKTCFLVADLLGLNPWQKYGGVVDKPEHLHLISLDTAALAGVHDYLKAVGAPPEAFKFHVVNMEKDVKRVSLSQGQDGNGWDYEFYNLACEAIKRVRDRVRTGGVHAVVVSSLTTLALALERGMAGPPRPSGKGGGMDQSKWQDFARQLNEVRNLLQMDSAHCLWEGHIYVPPKTGQPKKGEDDETSERKETIQVSGKAGYNFPNNVAHVFRIRRAFGVLYPGSTVEKTWIDTRPTMEFVGGGRMVNERLEPKEDDLTLVYKKLGYQVGRWGFKSKKGVSR